MSTLITRAFLLAEEIHATQQRKASVRPGIPYMGHLLEVAGTVMACGGPEVAVAAALLHDAIEDQGASTRVAIGNQLGSEVLAMVEECTEPGTGGAIKPPWQDRKDAALAKMSQASLLALLVLAADKLSNARDLRRTVILKGEQTYTLFRAGKAGIHWYHKQVIQSMQNRLTALKEDHPDEVLLFSIQCLIQELSEVTTSLETH